MEDQDDLSGGSEEESVSYSAPVDGSLSRDPSEPLFEADFTMSLPDPQPDTEDLLGLNSDPGPATAAPQPAAAAETGLKTYASNSDLLNDMFAPPSGSAHTAEAEDLFFTSPPSQPTVAPAAPKGETLLLLHTRLSCLIYCNLLSNLNILPPSVLNLTLQKIYAPCASCNELQSIRL